MSPRSWLRSPGPLTREDAAQPPANPGRPHPQQGTHTVRPLLSKPRPGPQLQLTPAPTRPQTLRVEATSPRSLSREGVRAPTRPRRLQAHPAGTGAEKPVLLKPSLWPAGTRGGGAAPLGPGWMSADLGVGGDLSTPHPRGLGPVGEASTGGALQQEQADGQQIQGEPEGSQACSRTPGRTGRAARPSWGVTHTTRFPTAPFSSQLDANLSRSASADPSRLTAPTAVRSDAGPLGPDPEDAAGILGELPRVEGPLAQCRGWGLSKSPPKLWGQKEPAL